MAHEIAAAPAALPPLPDEILEDIFVRLDDAGDLARASAACTTFRRVVSARRFLRRFRSLHAPPILGCLASEYPLFHPVDPPHRSAAAAAALAQAADFDFSFIDPRNNWNVRDVRDGRVLLSTRYYPPEPFHYLVVCDPLHRRYATVPGIPADLRPTSPDRRLRPLEFEPFLAPANQVEEGEEEHMPFRVICNVMYKSKFVTLVYSSVTGEWQPATSFSYKYTAPFVRHFAHNCFYWTHVVKKDMLVLNLLDMKFSVVNLPPRILQGWQAANNERAIVDAGEGRLGLLAIGSDECCLELYLKTMGNDGVGTEDWQHDKTIPLPKYYYWSMCGAHEGCLILYGVVPGWYKLPKYSEESHKQYFAVELKTLLVERLCVFNPIQNHVFPYASFPPPFSLPSI